MTNPNKPHPLLAEVAGVIERVFTPVPDREGHALPTSEEALLAVEESLGRARQRWEDQPELRQGSADEKADVLMQLEQVGELCRAARRVGFSGKISAIVGAALLVIVLLVIGQKTNKVPIMAAAVIWTAAVPLYLRSAVAPRWKLYARVLSSEESLDDRFMNFLSRWPPVLAPLGLVLRSIAYGVLAPSLVLLEAKRSGKQHLIVVMLAVIAGLTWWGWTWADWQPPEPSG